MANQESIHELKNQTHILQQRIHSLLQDVQRTIAMGSKVPPDRKSVLAFLDTSLGQSMDVTLRTVLSRAGVTYVICYLDSLVDPQQVDDDIVRPLLHSTPDRITVANLESTTDWADVLFAVVRGKTAVFPQGEARAYIADTQKPPHRSIERPQTEQSIRGPQQGFSDLITEQIGQLRRFLTTPNVVFEQLSIGRRSSTIIVYAYIRGLARPELVEQVREHLDRAEVDAVISSTVLASYLRERPYAIFPTVRSSERVDLAAWELLNGKVVILVNNDPFALWVPSTLADFYRTASDFGNPWYSASFIRIIRFLGWAFGLYLPALYLAVTEVNPQLVPPPLLILTAGSHTGLPFTPIVEVIVMILIIEILREAALRLPQMLGTTIGTVGAIVVGTAIVKAGFVSAQIIVVITLTALSFFSVPSYELIGSWRLVNWIMLLSAFVYGIYGIILATIGMTLYLVSLTSFGVPYLAPWAPFRPRDWENTLWREPWTQINTRLTEARPQDIQRIASEEEPTP